MTYQGMQAAYTTCQGSCIYPRHDPARSPPLAGLAKEVVYTNIVLYGNLVIYVNLKLNIPGTRPGKESPLAGLAKEVIYSIKVIYVN